MSLYKKRHFLLVGFMSGLLIFALLLSAIVGGNFSFGYEFPLRSIRGGTI